MANQETLPQPETILTKQTETVTQEGEVVDLTKLNISIEYRQQQQKQNRKPSVGKSNQPPTLNMKRHPSQNLMFFKNKNMGINLKSSNDNQLSATKKFRSPQFDQRTDQDNFSQLMISQSIRACNQILNESLFKHHRQNDNYSRLENTGTTCTPMKIQPISQQSIQEVNQFLEESPEQLIKINFQQCNLVRSDEAPFKKQSDPFLFKTSLTLRRTEKVSTQSLEKFKEVQRDLSSKTIDNSQDIFFPSNKSNFSYEPKYYKPNRQSVNRLQQSGNSPISITNSTNHQDLQQFSNTFRLFNINTQAISMNSSKIIHEEVKANGKQPIITVNNQSTEQSFSSKVQAHNNFVLTPRQLSIKNIVVGDTEKQVARSKFSNNKNNSPSRNSIINVKESLAESRSPRTNNQKVIAKSQTTRNSLDKRKRVESKV